MYRIININSREILSLDEIETIEESLDIAKEIESHESQPEVAIEQEIDGEWT